MSPERVRELFGYDHATGALTWRMGRGKAKAGDVAGVEDDRGYVVIGGDGKRHYAHRIVWLHVTGSVPRGVIDHIDGIRSNNRFANLRDVSHQVNMQNQRAPSRNCRSGALGVRSFGKKYRAQISVNRVTHHLGTFNTKDEARDAYLAAKRMVHDGCTL